MARLLLLHLYPPFSICTWLNSTLNSTKFAPNFWVIWCIVGINIFEWVSTYIWFRATRHEILPSVLPYQALMLLQITQTFATNKLKQRNVKINFFWVFVCSKLFLHNIISPGLTLTIKTRQNYLQSPRCICQKKPKIGPRYI